MNPTLRMTFRPHIQIERSSFAREEVMSQAYEGFVVNTHALLDWFEEQAEQIKCLPALRKTLDALEDVQRAFFGSDLTALESHAEAYLEAEVVEGFLASRSPATVNRIQHRRCQTIAARRLNPDVTAAWLVEQGYYVGQSARSAAKRAVKDGSLSDDLLAQLLRLNGVSAADANSAYPTRLQELHIVAELVSEGEWAHDGAFNRPATTPMNYPLQDIAVAVALADDRALLFDWMDLADRHDGLVADFLHDRALPDLVQRTLERARWWLEGDPAQTTLAASFPKVVYNIAQAWSQYQLAVSQALPIANALVASNDLAAGPIGSLIRFERRTWDSLFR